MGKRGIWRTFATAFTVATVVYAIRTKRPSGEFLRVPYEFRIPTWSRFRERFWNREDTRIFTPQVFGVGWSVNVFQLVKRLRGDRDEDLGARLPQEPRGQSELD